MDPTCIPVSKCLASNTGSIELVAHKTISAPFAASATDPAAQSSCLSCPPTPHRKTAHCEG